MCVSVFGTMVADVDELEQVGSGGTGHWPQGQLWLWL